MINFVNKKNKKNPFFLSPRCGCCRRGFPAQTAPLRMYPAKTDRRGRSTPARKPSPWTCATDDEPPRLWSHAGWCAETPERRRRSWPADLWTYSQQKHDDRNSSLPLSCPAWQPSWEATCSRCWAPSPGCSLGRAWHSWLAAGRTSWWGNACCPWCCPRCAPGRAAPCSRASPAAAGRPSCVDSRSGSARCRAGWCRQPEREEAHLGEQRQRNETERERKRNCHFILNSQEIKGNCISD